MLEKYPHKEVADVTTVNGSKPVYLLDINGKNVVFYLSAIGSALAGNDIIEISWQTGIVILLYGDCTSTFKVRSTVALAEIFLTGFLPFSDMLCIDKFCFV